MFVLAAELYDKETWGQIKTPVFNTREEAEVYCREVFPAMVRFDVFHGLQRIQIVETCSLI